RPVLRALTGCARRFRLSAVRPRRPRPELAQTPGRDRRGRGPWTPASTFARFAAWHPDGGRHASPQLDWRFGPCGCAADDACRRTGVRRNEISRFVRAME